jgi:hypothetical protein
MCISPLPPSPAKFCFGRARSQISLSEKFAFRVQSVVGGGINSTWFLLGSSVHGPECYSRGVEKLANTVEREKGKNSYEQNPHTVEHKVVFLGLLGTFSPPKLWKSLRPESIKVQYAGLSACETRQTTLVSFFLFPSHLNSHDAPYCQGLQTQTKEASVCRLDTLPYFRLLVRHCHDAIGKPQESRPLHW